MQIKRDNNTTGAAGAFYVAAALSLRGIIVTMTLRNARGIDLLATDGSKSIMIQVKTSSRKNKEWQVGTSIEKEHSPDLFFVFVDLGDVNEIPSFHIVPSNIVAEYCKTKADDWIHAASGKDRETREKYNNWKFRDKESFYLNRWDLLCLNVK
jgi:hypothetical protein